MSIYSLQKPDQLDFEVNGRIWYGYSQDWYQDEWHRRAGCGPTTATYLAAYCLHRDGIWKDLHNTNAVLMQMNRIWDYVTPRQGGLYKTRWLRDGLEMFFQEAGMQNYHARMLTVSVVPHFRPSSEEVLNFIKAGLDCDSPVAFLNRHRGNQETIDSWHWVPIVRLDTDQSPAIADVYDEGIKKILRRQNGRKKPCWAAALCIYKKHNSTLSVQ